MKIFPAVHYSMGGLWVDYERSADGGLVRRLAPQPADQHPRPVRHRRVRLPVSRRQPPGRQFAAVCIFSGLFVAPGIENLLKLAAGPRRPTSSSIGCSSRPAPPSRRSTTSCWRRAGGGENPYLIHQELGDVMTKAATVVRHNDQLRDAYRKSRRAGRAGRALLALRHGQLDQPERRLHQGPARHVPAGQGDPQGALARDECRGAHFKPEFAMPGIEADDPAEHRRQAESGATRSRKRTASGSRRRSPRSTHGRRSRPSSSSYEEVDTSLIPPRPRLYGLVGGEVIEEVWKARQKK